MEDKEVAKIVDWWEGDSALDPVKRNAYWKALGSARKEFDDLDHGYYEPTSDKFKVWLLDTYGVEMYYQGTNISGQFKVVDEHKYTIFLLKHSEN